MDLIAPTRPLQPLLDPENPFQTFGWLSIQKIHVAFVSTRPLGVELVLNQGISIAIPARELLRYHPQKLSKLSRLLQLGASFPELSFRLIDCGDFVPRAFIEKDASSQPSGDSAPPSPPRPKLSSLKDAPPFDSNTSASSSGRKGAAWAL